MSCRGRRGSRFSARRRVIRNPVACDARTHSQATAKTIYRRLASIDLVHLERRTMDYVKPADVVSAMIAAGKTKATLSSRDLLISGMLSGGLLGAATSLAVGATFSTGQPIVGAIIFPVGFVMIVILGLELVTGSFALVPLAKWEGTTTSVAVIGNWGWVFL